LKDARFIAAKFVPNDAWYDERHFVPAHEPFQHPKRGLLLRVFGYSEPYARIYKPFEHLEIDLS
jgi:hypothetical protein